MGRFLIRDVEEDVKAKLIEKARLRGISLEEMVVSALTAAALSVEPEDEQKSGLKS